MVNTQPTRKPSSYARLILTGFIRKPLAFAGAFSHVYLLLHQNVGQGLCRCLAHKRSSTLPMVARLAGLYLVVASWIMSSDNCTSTARTLCMYPWDRKAAPAYHDSYACASQRRQCGVNEPEVKVRNDIDPWTAPRTGGRLNVSRLDIAGMHEGVSVYCWTPEAWEAE